MNRKLEVTEVIESGLFGGPYNTHFDFYDMDTMFKIAVEQCGIRTIKIFAPDNTATNELLSVYYRVRTILFLSDGQFYQIEKAVENDVEITHSLIKRELPYFESADFMIGRGNLFNSLKVLSSDFLCNWSSIQSDLDISFKVMLYCVSSVKLPVDMKCAFLIESFIPLAELIQNRMANFKLPKIMKGESKLQKYLTAIITDFGQDIFCKECSEDTDIFTRILKDSRNRIAHVKQKQGQIVLNGEESALYLCKLSLLYRAVLLNLIGIPHENYKNKLISNANAFDLNQKIISDFITKWQTANKRVPK